MEYQEWDCHIIYRVCEKYNLMVKHNECSEAIQWQHQREFEEGDFMKRMVEWHRIDFDFLYKIGQPTLIKTCKHCMNLSQVKLRCRCAHSPVNARIQTNSHFDVNIDSAKWNQRLKPIRCAIDNKCSDNNCGWVTFQYYLERAECSPSSRGRLYFLAKAAFSDFTQSDKFRRYREKWQIYDHRFPAL